MSTLDEQFNSADRSAAGDGGWSTTLFNPHDLSDQNPAGVESVHPTPAQPDPDEHPNAGGHSCGGCQTRWAGLSACHCSACHRTFSGVSLFDQHRRVRGDAGYCVDPATLLDHRQPLRLVDGVWSSPPMTKHALDARISGKSS